MAQASALQPFEISLIEVRDVIEGIAKATLVPIKDFSIDGSKEWSQQIGNEVKEKLKELGTDPNYKY